MINERHIYRYCCRNGDSENPHSATPAVASSPTQLKEWAVEEAAMPGQPARTHARFRFPPAIHPRELPVCRQFAAIIVRRALGGPTFSVNPLCGRSSGAATEKHLALVQKLWTMRLPCGGLRKIGRNRRSSGNFHHPHSPSLTKIPRRTLGCCRCGLRQDRNRAGSMPGDASHNSPGWSRYGARYSPCLEPLLPE
jgi:hypothetical protein